MNNADEYEILTYVLSKMLDKTIVSATYQTKQLQGGTLGDVRLVMGIAETVDSEKLPYKVVWKKQKTWERSGNPNSWRREYDLYQSNLGVAFTPALQGDYSNYEGKLWLHLGRRR